MKFIRKYWQMAIISIITVGLGLMSFLITQRLNTTKPVAPNVPQAKPKAAGLLCTKTFTLITETPTPTSTPSGTITHTPTPTGLQCNSTCSSTGPACPNNLTCSNGHCRNSQCTSETDCSCPGTTNTPTKTPTSTSYVTHTPTPTRLACNAFCDNTSNSCSSGLVCSNGKCRNPSCTGETDCSCPGVANTPTPTYRPGTTPNPTTPPGAPTPKIPVSGAGTTILGATVIGGGLLLLLLGLAL